VNRFPNHFWNVYIISVRHTALTGTNTTPQLEADWNKFCCKWKRYRLHTVDIKLHLIQTSQGFVRNNKPL